MKNSIAILLAPFLLFIQSFSFAQTNDNKILEAVLLTWKDKGEAGVKEYYKMNQEMISSDFIINLSQKGYSEVKEDKLKIAQIFANERNEKKLSAEVLFNYGQYYYSFSNDDAAKDYFGKALAIYIEIKDEIGQGNVIKREGDIFYFTGKRTEAIELYEKALTHFQNVNYLAGIGKTIKAKADVFRMNGEFQKAIDLFGEALSFLERADDLSGQATVYQSMGDVYVLQGEIQKTLDMYKKALPLYEKVDDVLGQGSIYKRQGDVLYYIGETEKSMEMYDKALPFYIKKKSIVGQGLLYKGKGDIFQKIGDNRSAMEMYDKALEMSIKGKTPVAIGNAYKAKGDIYGYIGENQKAMEMYEKALSEYMKENAPLGLGNIYRNIGEIYFNTGENQKALEMAEKALPYHQKLNAPLALGNLYAFEGDIYFYLNDYQKAMDMQEKALQYFIKAGEPVGQGNSTRVKGDLFCKMGENQKAIEMYDKALPQLQKAKAAVALGNLYRSKGDIAAILGNKQNAIEMYDEAFKYFNKGGYIANQASTLFKKANLMDDKIIQADLYRNAIQLIEKIRSNTGFSESKKAYMQSIYSDYENAALFMLNNKFKDESFKFVEGLKARTFLDLLVEGKADLDAGISDELKQKRDEADIILSKLNKALITEYSKDNLNRGLVDSLENELKRNENELNEIKKQIRINNPKYASVKYPQAVTISELQDSCLKPNEVIMEYFLSKNGCYVSLIGKKIFEIIKIDSNYNKIAAACNVYLSELRAYTGKNDMKLPPAAKKASIALYNILFAPVMKYIEGKYLIIIPDGVLSYLPFETIKTDKDKYLIERFKIKYVQSATILNLLRTQYKKEGLTDWFVGFGDPVYDYENWKNNLKEEGTDLKSLSKGGNSSDFVKSRFFRTGYKLNRLIGSGIEVKEIGELFGKNSEVYIREKALEKNAKEDALSKYKYIHFSTHGIIDDDFQAIALSQLPDSSSDGFLTFDKIMNSKYTNAKLVVLSACQTGLGKEEQGEGITGLTRAVMYAGSPAAVVSLWSVSDEGTKDFMIDFYRNLLKNKMSSVDALRKTKLTMIKSKEYSSPFFWAAFVMYGE